MDLNRYNFYTCSICNASVSTGFSKKDLMSYYIPIDDCVLRAYIEINSQETFVEKDGEAIASIDQFIDPSEVSLDAFRDIMKLVIKHEKLKNFQ